LIAGSGPSRSTQAKRVLHFARDVLYDEWPEKGAPLPESAKTFHQSYKQAFGEEDSTGLKQLWQKRGYALPKDL